MPANRTLACQMCGCPTASGLCRECAAEVYDEWRAEQDAARRDEMTEPVNPDAPF